MGVGAMPAVCNMLDYTYYLQSLKTLPIDPDVRPWGWALQSLTYPPVKT